MIQAYSTNVAVTSGTAIPFENVALVKGCTVRLSGTRVIQFNRAGVYLIHVNATANSTTATTGDITLQLYKDGVALPSSVMSATVADATSNRALAFTALITVPNSNSCKCMSNPTLVTVQNVGVDATYDNVNVVVTKVA